MTDQKPKVQSYILWYRSKSHGAKVTPPQPFIERYFVGVNQIPCATHGFHLKPSWTYEKEAATVLDGDQGLLTKDMVTGCGYTEVVLEPIDEVPSLQTPVTTSAPESSELSKLKTTLGLDAGQKVH